MGWETIQRCYRDLFAACQSGAPLSGSWNAYREAVLATSASPPYHLILPLRLAEDAAARRSREDIKILDHGCGGAGTLLFLLASGYTGVFGVDVGGSCTVWNRLLQEQFGIPEPRFFIFDGAKLPFPDDTFDLIFSEEVVEHVTPSLISDYYSEGARVLRQDGISYFTVPHRLAPYDSHTRTWFVHYLPKSIGLRIYPWITDTPNSFMEHHLFLRSPGYHRRMLAKFYAATEDVTRKRLNRLTSFEYYDGPQKLRRLLARAAAIPGVGSLIGHAIAPVMMRQTLSCKTGSRIPDPYR